MPDAVSFTLKLEKRPGGWWDTRGRKQIRAGLLKASAEFRKEIGMYPPASAPIGLRGTHQRRGDLARWLTGSVTQYGSHNRLEMHGPVYVIYLLEGTGIYGKRRMMITAKGNHPLIWGIRNPTHPGFGKLAVARAVRGTIWAGKKARIQAAMQRALLAELARAG